MCVCLCHGDCKWRPGDVVSSPSHRQCVVAFLFCLVSNLKNHKIFFANGTLCYVYVCVSNFRVILLKKSGISMVSFIYFYFIYFFCCENGKYQFCENFVLWYIFYFTKRPKRIRDLGHYCIVIPS